MQGKKDRQRLIRELVRNNKVSSQEELAALLARSDCDVAQATLSRDIREMRIAKVHDEDGYYYRLPVPGSHLRLQGDELLSASVERVEFAGPVLVICTRPGHANMIASAVDAAHLRPVIGTVAGDDTVMLVYREGISRGEVTEALSTLIKDIENKVIH